MKNVAVIFAGGTGERMGENSTPKQFLTVGGKPVLAFTLEHFQRHAEIDGIVLVALSSWIGYCKEMAGKYRLDKLSAVVAGGATSQESIYIGLKTAMELYGEDTVALIHDGVRPLIDENTITACIQCVRQYGSAVTVSPQMETILYGETAVGPSRIIDRDRCQVARAPQCFYLRDILRAHQKAMADHKLRFIDSASLMEYYGYELHLVRGPIENIKITTALDFQVFCAIVTAGGVQRWISKDAGEETPDYDTQERL